MSKTVMYQSKNAINQSFSLSPTIISYICKNPKINEWTLKKLYFSCKYFWPKFNMFPIFDIHFDDDKVMLHHGKRTKKEKIYSLNIKFFVYDRLEMRKHLFIEKTIISTLISKKMWRFKMRMCKIKDQIISLEEFIILSKCVSYLDIYDCRILRSDMSSPATLDEIYLAGENIHSLTLQPLEEDYSAIYSEEALQNFCNIQRDRKYGCIILYGVTGSIDPMMLGGFIKNNSWNFASICLRFYQTTKEWEESFVKDLKNELKFWRGWSCKVYGDSAKYSIATTKEEDDDYHSVKSEFGETGYCSEPQEWYE